MRAIHVHPETSALYIGHAPDPEPGEGELLVSVKATALNRADLLQRIGKYPPPPGVTDILGLEMAGVVERAGSGVSGWAPGDRVCALLPGGGYAEKAVIPAGMAMRIPAHLSFEEAAAIPEVFLTAYLNLFELGGLVRGETVLIHAGASGVGTAAIQLAREAGARVIATAGTEEKLQTCLELGANCAVNYKRESFADRVLEATNGKGAQLILDLVGASHWEQNLRCIAMDGRWVVIGVLGGGTVERMSLSALLGKRVSLLFSTLRSRPVREKIALTQQFLRFAAGKFETGALRPVVDRIYSWTEAEAAHEYMQSNRNIGKIVLRVGD